MNLYKINISSAGDGWSDLRTTEGIIYEADGKVCIEYSLDGDECTLTVVNGSKAVQRRRGGQNIEISFEQGAKTECVIGDGEVYGSFEVYTKSLKIIKGKVGYKLSLEYISGSDGELVQLTFTAVKKGIRYEN